MGAQALAQANDGKALLTQVNAQLRQAEKAMFAGQTEQAVQALDPLKQLLAAAAAADPGSVGLKSAEKKYASLVQDLERRTGKNLGGGTLTAAGAGVQRPLPDKPVAADLPAAATAPAPAGDSKPPAAAATQVPHAARKPLADALHRLEGLERNLADLADPAYPGDKDQLVRRADEKLAEVRSLLAEAQQAAADKGVASHPDIDQVTRGLAAAEKTVAVAKGGHAQNKAEMAAKSKAVDADVANLQAEYERVRPVFDAASGAVPHYNDLKPVADLIARIEAFEKDGAPGITRGLKAFAEKYGATREEIDKKAEANGYTGQQRASRPFTDLSEGLEAVRKTRPVLAEDLITRAADQLAGIEGAHDFTVAGKLTEYRAWVAMASRFQADHPKVRQAQAGLDQQIAQAMKAFNARIDKRTWPGHADTAPSNGKQLARAALDWFRSSPEWGAHPKRPSIPLAVVVTGPWSVQQRNILGEPTMHGLPVLLAVRVDEDKDLNVARVFGLTLRTAERAGVKMEPPFDHAAVGDSYFIRPSAIK
jgi:hypothetical protein